MSNRAKLPKGVENIRPHIEQVDNVPLQVSLFTDCVGAGPAREMVRIMQDYGEVVCCVATPTPRHTHTLLTADASLCVGVGDGLSSLACCLRLRHPVPLHALITQARRMCCVVRCGLELWAGCGVCAGAVQAVGAVLLLAPPLRPAQVLWLGMGVTPLLALHARDTPPPPTKNLGFASTQGVLSWCACWCVRFLPSSAVALLAFSHILHDDPENISLGQDVFALLLVLYFGVISVSFVHRSRPLWRGGFSKGWATTAVALVLVQCAWLWGGFARVPTPVLVLGGLWPLLALPLNEMVRRHEIKVSVRQQKRARLEFCTKLGMNSPF